MQFLGVDLAWIAANPASDSNSLCTLDSNGSLPDLATCASDLEIPEFIQEDGIGIDAPLRVPYAQGMCKCQRSPWSKGVRILSSNRRFMTVNFGGLRGEAIAKGFSSRVMLLQRHQGQRRKLASKSVLMEHSPCSLKLKRRTNMGLQNAEGAP